MKKTTTLKVADIPTNLLKEEIGGVKYYYAGFRDVINKNKTLEAIMGSSGLQSLLIDCLFRVIYGSKAILKDYHILSNDSGFHFGKHDKLAFDIALYEKSKLKARAIDAHYIKGTAPKVVFEIDTQVELAEIPKNPAAENYLFFKTDRIHAIGTNTVVWVLSKPQKVMIAHKGKAWTVQDWNSDFEVLEMQFNIGAYLKAEGIDIEKSI